jgi:hypothetical protein
MESQMEFLRSVRAEVEKTSTKATRTGAIFRDAFLNGKCSELVASVVWRTC